MALGCIKNPDELLEAIEHFRKRTKHGGDGHLAIKDAAIPMLVAVKNEMSNALMDTEFDLAMEHLIDEVASSLTHLHNDQLEDPFGNEADYRFERIGEGR